MAGWSKRPTTFIKVVEDDVMKKRKEIAQVALQAVISGSPVDKGTFKGNHRVSIDGEDLGYDPDIEDVAGSEALARGEQLIGSIDTPFGETVIQNNVPYGEELELGHSEQASKGVYGPAFVALKERFTR